jgi:hypothetical protein
VHALPGAVNAVLALDNPRMLASAYTLHEFTAGHRLEVGPFQVDTWALPHFVPNAGMRLTADGHVLAYTGDTGPSPDIATMALDADVLLAEATFPEHVLPEKARHTCPPRARPPSTPPKPAPGALCSPIYGRAPIHRLHVTPPGRLTPPISTSPPPGHDHRTGLTPRPMSWNRSSSAPAPADSTAPVTEQPPAEEPQLIP